MLIYYGTKIVGIICAIKFFNYAKNKGNAWEAYLYCYTISLVLIFEMIYRLISIINKLSFSYLPMLLEFFSLSYGFKYIFSEGTISKVGY